jgi:hypothetical protein
LLFPRLDRAQHDRRWTSSLVQRAETSPELVSDPPPILDSFPGSSLGVGFIDGAVLVNP